MTRRIEWLVQLAAGLISTFAVIQPIRAADDQDGMSGWWRFTVLRTANATIEPQNPLIASITVKIQGDKWTVLNLGSSGPTTDATFVLAPNSQPKQLTIHLPGTVVKGIYELAGDSLRACLSPETEAMPIDFQPDPASGQWLVELRRIPADSGEDGRGPRQDPGRLGSSEHERAGICRRTQ